MKFSSESQLVRENARLTAQLAQTEQALRASESKLNTLIELLPAGISILGPHRELLQINPALARILAMTPAEILHGDFRRRRYVDRDGHPVPPEQLPSLRAVQEQRAIQDVELGVELENGAMVWTLVSAAPLPTPDMSAVVVTTDITARKRAEAEIRALTADLEARVAERTHALAEIEERTQLLLEASSIGTFEVDLETEHGVWNKIEYELLGLTPDSIPGGPSSFFNYVHPDDAAGLAAQWQAALSTGSLDAEFRIVRPDGQTRWVAGKGGFVHRVGENGRVPHRFLGVNFDITARKQAEEALRESEARFKAIAANTPDHVLAQDRALRYTMVVNPQLRLTEAEMLGKTDDELLPPGDAAHLTEIKQRVLETGVPENLTVSLHDRAGELEYFEGSYVPRLNAAGAVDGILGYFRNVTERTRRDAEIQHLNAQLAARAAELEAANRELESFSYSVSHDLRAPLRALDGFSRILLEDFAVELSPEAQRYLQFLRENAQEMGKLVDDLLAFSRFGRQELNKETVDPTPLVRQLTAERAAAEAGRRFEIVIRKLPPCRADPALLKQVWVNLLDNAFKFTRTRVPARIEIGARQEGGVTEYFVQDNGVGFDMQYAEKLFGVFQRLHRAEEYPGTGVGLAIVQRIVQRHGGHVRAEAKPNEGATLYFSVEGRPQV